MVTLLRGFRVIEGLYILIVDTERPLEEYFDAFEFTVEPQIADWHYFYLLSEDQAIASRRPLPCSALMTC
jgi:hypothetical protein